MRNKVWKKNNITVLLKMLLQLYNILHILVHLHTPMYANVLSYIIVMLYRSEYGTVHGCDMMRAYVIMTVMSTIVRCKIIDCLFTATNMATNTGFQCSC